MLEVVEVSTAIPWALASSHPWSCDHYVICLAGSWSDLATYVMSCPPKNQKLKASGVMSVGQRLEMLVMLGEWKKCGLSHSLVTGG
ncbi:hypothetical protein PoB_004075200 [Plakobranchus ocellatus]|uniref:Uncharacterized protein n=1 Tax=Plakobranchus ocellatus TaxID=259542 RepID=A0AAV4B4W3_9GAST|nr:hypothetical protein PoB_004075200 [Plakobranchus ocellatus]